MKKFILDTNVLLNDPSSILSFENNHVIIPMTVLEELDNIKSRGTDVSRDARVVIRQLSDIIGDCSNEELFEGIKISDTIKGVPEGALLSVINDSVENFALLDLSIPDNRIINTTLYIQNQHKDDDVQVLLISNDINMRIKAKSSGVNFVESHKNERSIQDIDILHKGFIQLQVPIFDVLTVQTSEFNKSKKVTVHSILKNDKSAEIFKLIRINDYILDSDETFIRFIGENEDHYFCSEPIKKKPWKLESKNVYQSMAISALMDKNIDLVVLLGSAGTGKTLLTVSAGLEQTMESRTYSRIIFTRSMHSQFEEIGFLPGDEKEKVAPWCGAAQDAIEFLHQKDANPQASIKYIEDKGIFQYKALNFIRGRSFKDVFLVIDEAQNLTATQMKTILTRAGEGTKIILMGNLAQIDNDYVSELSSGLTYVVEKFKGWEGCSIIQLQDTVRSRLSEFAEKNL